jgi:hypothetical protein
LCIGWSVWMRIGRNGTTHFVASVGAVTTKVEVRVDVLPKFLSAFPDSLWLLSGEQFHWGAVLRDSLGFTSGPPAPLTWQSLDPGIATVDSSGLVKAISPGTAQIVIQSPGMTATAPVRVLSAALRFTSLTAGASLACGITIDSLGFCNDLPPIFRTRPWQSTLKFTSVVPSSSWDGRVCGIGLDSLGWCQTGSSVLSQVLTDHKLVSLILPGEIGSTVCGFATDSLFYCADPGTSPAPPAPPAGGVRLASVTGQFMVCALGAIDSLAYCGLPQGQVSMPLSAVPGTPKLASVRAGQTHACGATLAGTVYCWGTNAYGQLGWQSQNADPTTSYPAALVSGVTGVVSLATGRDQTCALVGDGTAYCWGLVFSSAPTYEPKVVPGGLRFQSLAAGAGYTCGIVLSGGAYCWSPSLGETPVRMPVTAP